MLIRFLMVFTAFLFVPCVALAGDIQPEKYKEGCEVGGRGAGPKLLKLDGPDEIREESVYEASSGFPEYSYSLEGSCGTINSTTGVVGNVDTCCGSTRVVATDKTGQKAYKDVRFPGGKWVKVRTHVHTIGTNPDLTFSSPYYRSTYEGKEKTFTDWRCFNNAGGGQYLSPNYKAYWSTYSPPSVYDNHASPDIVYGERCYVSKSGYEPCGKYSSHQCRWYPADTEIYEWRCQ